MIDNIEQLKKAIEIEIQYRYIDIHGKTQPFSTFIKNEAKRYYKLSQKNPKWAVIAEAFEHYPFAGLNERRKSIDNLIRVLKSETKPKLPKNEIANAPDLAKSAKDTDVMYMKGVGPKIAYKLNKLGIYTVQDLMMYFPKKHIDCLTDLTDEDEKYVWAIHKAMNKIAEEQGFKENGYRVIVNCGKDSGQEVMHLHYHLLAGAKFGDKIV